MGSMSRTVEILECTFGYFPKRFRWRGRPFMVDRIERIWCVRRAWPRRIARRQFVLRTPEGVFQISHDLVGGQWTARRIPRLRARVPLGAENTWRVVGDGPGLVVV